MGDFNCVLHAKKRSSKNGEYSSFQKWVAGRGLINVGFIGSKYTWSHEVSMETRKSAILDKALCCIEWRRMFIMATIRHLSHSHTDQRPVFLDQKGVRLGRLGVRLFRFQAAWLLHAEYAK